MREAVQPTDMHIVTLHLLLPSPIASLVDMVTSNKLSLSFMQDGFCGALGNARIVLRDLFSLHVP